MRFFVPVLIVLAVLYFWDQGYNNGKLADGLDSMRRSISRNGVPLDRYFKQFRAVLRNWPQQPRTFSEKDQLKCKFVLCFCFGLKKLPMERPTPIAGLRFVWTGVSAVKSRRMGRNKLTGCVFGHFGIGYQRPNISEKFA